MSDKLIFSAFIYQYISSVNSIESDNEKQREHC